MTTVIKHIRKVGGCYSLIFAFLIKAQSQQVQDIIAYHPFYPEQQIGANQPGNKNDSSGIITYALSPASNLSPTAAALSKTLEVFGELKPHETYQFTLAADVPDNKRPEKVYYKKETGHVFIILEKSDSLKGTSVAQVFGFYPIRPVGSLFLRTVQCEILNNSGRSYDACITLSLTAAQFNQVTAKAVELTSKKYNLNEYNCYDYAVELYNSIEGVEDMTLQKVKFPFVFGRGGSPCGLYKQLMELQDKNTGALIFIGQRNAPQSAKPIP